MQLINSIYIMVYVWNLEKVHIQAKDATIIAISVGEYLGAILLPWNEIL